MIFIVSYVLNEPGQRYQVLIDAIKSIGPWARLNESAYLVQCDLSAVQLRDKLKISIDGNDKLFVGQVTPPAAWAGLSDAVSQWIKDNLV